MFFIAISVLGIIAICVLNFSSNIPWKALFFKRCLYVEEYLVSSIAALLIFYLLELKIALPLWVVSYLLINLFFKKNAIIKGVYDINEHYVTRQFEKGVLTNKNLWKNKNFIVSCCVKKYKLRPIDVYFKYHTSFSVGLLISVLINILNDFTVTNHQLSQSTLDILLENTVLLTVILFYVYKIAYKLCVDNVNSTWFDNKKFFNIYYLLHCIVYYIIVIVISLH